MRSLNGCVALTVYVILARCMVGDVNSIILHISVANNRAIVGPAFNGRRVLHNSRVLNDEYEIIIRISFLSLLLESDVVLLL
jgi:hypothetical protein